MGGHMSCVLPSVPRVWHADGLVNLLSGLSSSRLVCDTCGMSPLSTNRYKNHRFPAEIISHGVWLYFRFCLSYRDVEELLFARGVMVTYEAIRKWCRKFGQEYGNQLRCRRPRPGDKWPLDEVFLTINGTRHYLWRAVDQDGYILDILVQSRRNKKAAKKFFRKLLKGFNVRAAGDYHRQAPLEVRCAPRRRHKRSGSRCCRGAAPREHPPASPPAQPAARRGVAPLACCWG
jgi:DDE domain